MTGVRSDRPQSKQPAVERSPLTTNRKSKPGPFSDRPPRHKALSDRSSITPTIVSKPYSYRSRAQNAEKPTLTYRLDTPLEGMSLDETS